MESEKAKMGLIIVTNDHILNNGNNGNQIIGVLSQGGWDRWGM